jgi:hypothetical protein
MTARARVEDAAAGTDADEQARALPPMLARVGVHWMCRHEFAEPSPSDGPAPGVHLHP